MVQEVFMLFYPFLSKRVNTIRNAHLLSHNDLAQVLNIKSKGNIYSWETQRSVPSIDVFNDIITLFGISSDWLLGYTNEPYNEKVLSSIETYILSQEFEFNGQNFKCLSSQPWIPKEYFDNELRSKTYSLPVRANLIFLFNNYLAYQQAALHDTEFAQKSFIHAKCVELQRFYRILSDPSTYAKKQKQRDFYIKSLQDLLAAKESAKPIFDIQAQKTTEE